MIEKKKIRWLAVGLAPVVALAVPRLVLAGEEGPSKEVKEVTHEEAFTPKEGLYLGLQGGAAFHESDNSHVTATNANGPWDVSVPAGGPFFNKDVFPGGPNWLDGNLGGDTGGVGGLKLGYEWAGTQIGSDPHWRIKPAIEFDGYWLGHDYGSALMGPLHQGATLFGKGPGPNFGDVLVPPGSVQALNLGGWSNNFDIGILAINGILKFETPWVTPYIGAGAAAAIVASNGGGVIQQFGPTNNLGGAGLTFATAGGNNEVQLAPAVQGIAGLELDLDKFSSSLAHWSIFAEYKFLVIGETDFTHPTVSPVPTVVSLGGGASQVFPAVSDTKVKLDSIMEHIVVGGIKYTF
ncbi:hypothetical protein [Candidatus Methylacidithermus pantelleriae]|uniref:Uncharacterized protein n=1 Tax=Candidatus Methylacidithermus pantelleriae TaxID=2744239 RepID=A0A8J2FR79_9BACT|nr:hypothetical protein [Candidatus Methylacidithermus pantelleriae]CAF0689036.1 hypothetical protein MPNT_10089 [Candidatus Methylacidithermus pantelleriae]